MPLQQSKKVKVRIALYGLETHHRTTERSFLVLNFSKNLSKKKRFENAAAPDDYGKHTAVAE